MDFHRCVVRHRGDLTMTISKDDMTPAHIVLLRMIHGSDAVVDIVRTREGKAPGLRARARGRRRPP